MGRPGLRGLSGTASISGPPAAPASIFVRSDTTRPDGFAAPVGAITFASAPNSIEFYDDGNPVSRFGQLHYVRTVPATGELLLQHSYTTGTSLDVVRVIAGRIQDAMAGPAVAITSPGPNSRAPRSRVQVTGTATDNGSVRSLTVNGVGVAVGAGGAWSRRVSLKRGANKITAEAADAQGNRTQAQITVSYGTPGALRRPEGRRADAHVSVAGGCGRSAARWAR